MPRASSSGPSALFFGRLGDLIAQGTFLVTILIMGISTFIVGIPPNYASIGVAAPVILICLRLLQGLALGGEYGGAAMWPSMPQWKRGATAWIQTTATMGLFLSLLVILGTRTLMGEPAFNDWGWRISFLVSIPVAGHLGVDPHAAVRVARLPQDEGRGQDLQGAPGRVLRSVEEPEDRAHRAVRPDRRPGRGLAHGQFYALFFLTQQLKVDAVTANLLIAAALLIGTPFFLIFGSLSDKIGPQDHHHGRLRPGHRVHFPAFRP